MKRSFQRQPLLALMVVGVLWMSASDTAAQCALCRDAVAASTPRTILAMNLAIVLLAFTPYAVFLLAAWRLFPAFRDCVKGGLARLLAGLRGATP